MEQLSKTEQYPERKKVIFSILKDNHITFNDQTFVEKFREFLENQSMDLNNIFKYLSDHLGLGEVDFGVDLNPIISFKSKDIMVITQEDEKDKL